MSYIIDTVRRISRENAEAQEKLLLNFFGSYENAVALAQYFVMETKEAEFDFDLDGELKNMYTMTMETRIRKRTKEELEEAGITKPFYEAAREVFNARN